MDARRGTAPVHEWLGAHSCGLGLVSGRAAGRGSCHFRFGRCTTANGMPDAEIAGTTSPIPSRPAPKCTWYRPEERPPSPSAADSGSEEEEAGEAEAEEEEAASEAVAAAAAALAAACSCACGQRHQ